MESKLTGSLIEGKTLVYIAHRYVGVAPSKEYHCIDKKGENEIDEHAGQHHYQTLPSGLCAKLPRLYGLRHLLLVHRFINHTGYFYVAAKRQPTEYVGSVALLGLKLKQAEPGIKEEGKLFHTDLKQASCQEMAAFVEEDQYGETQYQL